MNKEQHSIIHTVSGAKVLGLGLCVCCVCVCVLCVALVCVRAWLVFRVLVHSLVPKQLTRLCIYII
jgi:hypothetical protein